MTSMKKRVAATLPTTILVAALSAPGAVAEAPVIRASSYKAAPWRWESEVASSSAPVIQSILSPPATRKR